MMFFQLHVCSVVLQLKEELCGKWPKSHQSLCIQLLKRPLAHWLKEENRLILKIKEPDRNITTVHDHWDKLSFQKNRCNIQLMNIMHVQFFYMYLFLTILVGFLHSNPYFLLLISLNFLQAKRCIRKRQQVTVTHERWLQRL